MVAVLRKIAESKWCPDRLVGEDFFWEADRRELLQAMGLDCKYHLVISLKPGRNVSLYEIVWLMGASHKNWTPLLIRLESLFVDFVPPSASGLKGHSLITALDRFLEEIDLETAEKSYGTKDPSCCCKRPGAGFRTMIHETLYIQGGYTSFKSWRWGAVGRVNGTLLWPLIARRFAHEILTATDHLR